ncbi:hypothetical protein COU53_02130 [Candidatus Pacearchaeota archaeon CG10_big_fil_rev_8_21_14_0_10_30_48]|nr:MAG: hypothetical protein COU53_02130 [Candidatus Pacearchaeota archaeon CG10_big_fil_rev_8_21_14_0_10_30_48]
MIRKSHLLILVVLSIIVSLPVLLISGLFYTSNIIDLQFGSLLREFFPTGLLFLVSLIPIVSIFIALKIKEESEKYNSTSIILSIINVALIILNIFISFTIFTQGFH